MNVKIAIVTKAINLLTVLGFLFNGLYFPWMWLSSKIKESSIEHAVPVMHEAPMFYAIIAVTVVACGAFDFGMEAYRVLITQTPADFLRRLVNDGAPLVGLKAQ